MSLLEREILGSFLKDNTLLQETNLAVYHFNESHHKDLFKMMVEMAQQGKAIDHVTLMAENQSLILNLGGPAYVLDLQSKGNSNHFETYEQTLLEQYRNAETEKAITEWLASKEKDTRQLLDKIETIQDAGTINESDRITLLAELIDEVNNPKSSYITGIPSGLTELDKMTGGWQAEDSIILGARPSMGKTALMLKFMLSAARNGDVPIVFSLEMSAKALLRRLASTIGEINGYMARNPQNLNDGMQRKWTKAVGEISNLKFEIYDHSDQTIQYIRSKVRKAQKEYKGKRIIVMIDYLTLIQNPGRFVSDHAKYSDVSRRLKAIAKDYNLPVITLAQLSRGVEQRQDKRPNPSDLRESGSIEQDADVILMLYRDSYYNKESTKPNELEISVAKQRNGATGPVTVNYNRSTGVIKD
ncbi:replicative DNA helicase [Ornithinibacillus xuwenensis]|uniref:DNA 5'-3' helicase n=1 Tax=Ornithinibacillus xuwenensis TaxID=3144668 RepID=A0ABU9XBW5_9BACI